MQVQDFAQIIKDQLAEWIQQARFQESGAIKPYDRINYHRIIEILQNCKSEIDKRL